MIASSQQRLLEISEDDLGDRIKFFSTLPYQKGKFGSRHWGHTLHTLCSYPSKLKPAIAYWLITLFTKKGERVLDPFSGIGTIPLEACLNGRIGIGTDISPLAFHATHAKVNLPPKKEVENRISELQLFIENESLDSIYVNNIDAEIKQFYHPDTFAEILKARLYFEMHESDNISSLLISCIAHILHGNRPYALSRRSHNIIPIPPKGDFIYKSLLRSLNEKLNRMYEEPLPSNYTVGIASMSSVFDIPVSTESIETIITSPPFFGTTEFLRHNRIRLWFCGWDYSKQKSMKNEFISTDIGAYKGVFDEFNRVLKKGGLCIIHLGVVKDRDMALEILPLAEEFRFKNCGVVYEDTSDMESHGRTDRGGTHKHQFLFLEK